MRVFSTCVDLASLARRQGNRDCQQVNVNLLSLEVKHP